MKQIRIVILILVVCLSACSQVDDPQADIEAIRDIIETTATMNNAGDIEGWVALFEEGAVYMSANQPAITTREGLREAAESGFTSWRSDIQITPDEIVPSGDWAFARNHVSGSVTAIGGGKPIRIDLKQIVIYHRHSDGSWKIARLIGNSNTQ